MCIRGPFSVLHAKDASLLLQLGSDLQLLLQTLQAMQTPAARSSSGTPSGRVDSPVTSVPRLRGGSKQLAGATAAHADAAAPDEPAAHVVVKQPTPPVPWRIGTEAASPPPVPEAPAQAAPQASAQADKPRGRRGAARGKKRGRGS